MSSWTQEEIKSNFGGRLVGNNFTKNVVLNTLSKFPDDIVEYISKNVWILSSVPDAWAYTFTGDDLKEKHLIFLSEDLLSEPIPQIQFTLAHEFGHVILKHKNSINYKQSKAEINMQEHEANQFAYKYLQNNPK